MGKRPNFLYIITDQHRADWLGCMGHPVVKTPNIDELAARGTAFEEFHVASPVCMPNRATLLTGRMPSTHGLRYNGCVLSNNANTFVDVLREGGYATSAIGKSHLQPFSGMELPVRKSASGLPQPVIEAWKAMPGNYDGEQPKTYAGAQPAKLPKPYYGYDHVEMVTRHGDRTGGHYEQWFKANAPNWKELWDDANQLPHDYVCPQAFRTPVPEELYPTTWIADRAIEYIKTRKGEDEPFFSFVSFPDPHHPFNPPGKYWDMYKPEQFTVSLPYSTHRNPTQPMAFAKSVHDNNLKPEHPYITFYGQDRAICEAMALTAGMITMIDDQIGRILDALREAGLDDNTIVVFNSDHGDQMGDFNMLLKGPVPSRAVTRVPFIWSDLRQKENQHRNRHTKALASTLDIGATILEQAGFEPYNGMQGRSFGKILSGEADDHRQEVLIEYNAAHPQLGMRAPARVRCLLTHQWRYTLYPGENWGELYDLGNDPGETNNLWDNPDYSTKRTELAERLAAQMAQMMDTSPRANRMA